MKLSKIINWNPLVSKREGRFNIIGDNKYRFDRWLFNSVIVIILCLLCYVFYIYGFDFSTNIYYKCDETVNGCSNPFHLDNDMSPLSMSDKLKCRFDWCNDPVLPAGFEYGTKPSPLYNNVAPISYTLFIIAVILNHFLYNRGKLKDIVEEED